MRAEARVLYRDWEAACQKVDLEGSLERVDDLRDALKAAKDVKRTAFVMISKSELCLRNL